MKTIIFALKNKTNELKLACEWVQRPIFFRSWIKFCNSRVVTPNV